MAADSIPMTKSGFCQHPSPGSHSWCGTRKTSCTCLCHSDPELLAGFEAELAECAAGYPAGQEAESDNIPAGESGEGQGT